jgi:phospholipid/cholesterol/gamma-HCH transport system permease protein
MTQEKLTFDYLDPNTLQVKLDGDWRMLAGFPTTDKIIAELAAHSGITQITFKVTDTIKWDSGLISFLFELIKEYENKNLKIQREGLPNNIQKLLAFALTVSEKNIPPKEAASSFFERLGDRTLRVKESVFSLLDFLGQITWSFGRLIRGKAYFRRDDFMIVLQKCGSNALFLVSLISILIGMILAFVGAIQLKMFGAQIFIADMVGIGMVRLMGAVMAGVLMSGRTGASFAAELGIMQVNEEIDALKTLGINPVEFLVVPRVLALIIMMPLLTVYADFMGILGGLIISTSMFGISYMEYFNRIQNAVTLNHLWVGIVHSFIFGVIISIAGCYHGIKCGRSAAAVGEAITSAVVSAIMSIIVATAIITYICQIIGV